MVKCLELFSGAGGLAKGLEQSGIFHGGFIEWNKDSCETLRLNYPRNLVHNKDIKDIEFKQFSGVDLVAGGPPCQPFSLGGKHKGSSDTRDMFPYAIQAIRELKPKAFIFENVKGLLRKSFSSYFNYIVLQLSYPELTLLDGQSWVDHLKQLEEHHTKGKSSDLQYRVVYRLINAADYGVPQKRERVFIVGIREDLKMAWSFPNATHSEDALIWEKYVSGNYWDRHNLEKEKLKINSKYSNISNQLFPPLLKPWVTIRDSLSDVLDKWEHSSDHKYRAGARAYKGHTGSSLDEPSKTLKAGDHGVPGGENMIRYPDGSVRYLSIFEAKRLQTFPDNYVIHGSWTEAMRQIGNAVPVKVANVIAKSLITSLS